MSKINYSWNESNMDEPEIKLSTRKDLQLARRLFHMACGFGIATLYWLSFSHTQMIHFLGTLACVLYVVEQIRINYPETASKFLPLSRFVMRAEEQLKESAMVPYAFAVLLCILTFPKMIAIVAVYTLAISDPLSAIIGIRFGKTKIVPHKTLEGSTAFFISMFIISFLVLLSFLDLSTFYVFLISIFISFATSAFEMIPFKIDDNITIPLFVSFILWIVLSSFGVPF